MVRRNVAATTAKDQDNMSKHQEIYGDKFGTLVWIDAE